MFDHQYRWECVTEKAEFAPRDGAGALTFGGRMWLLGGWNPLDKEHFPLICNNEVWSSRDGVTWRLELPAAPWESRHTAGYAVFRDRMWVIGGDATQGHYQCDVWSSTDGLRWELVSDHVPWGPRALHYTVVFQGFLWVIGGQTIPQFAPAEERLYCDAWRSADGAEWECVTDSVPWPARGMIGGSAVLDDRIWLLGGGVYETPLLPNRTFRNDVWSTTDGLEWTEHTRNAPWKPRGYHDVAVFDHKLWVLEGYNRDVNDSEPSHGNMSDVWYSSDGEEWHETTDVPWPPRHASSVFVFDDALWVVTGNNLTSDVWRMTKHR